MIDDYQEVHIIDLLKDEKEKESRLTKEYYKLFYQNQYKEEGKLMFTHFDFHRFCKGDDFMPLRMLIG